MVHLLVEHTPPQTCMRARCTFLLLFSLWENGCSFSQRLAFNTVLSSSPFASWIMDQYTYAHMHNIWGINWPDSTTLVFSKKISLGYFLHGLLVVFISCSAETSWDRRKFQGRVTERNESGAHAVSAGCAEPWACRRAFLSIKPHRTGGEQRHLASL